ncbi:MAG: tetratricopeptide repeat protein [Bryobacteraceae bacterium]
MEATAAKGDPRLSDTLAEASRFFLSIGDRQQALDYARKSALLDEKAFGQDSARMAVHWEQLASLEVDPAPWLERAASVHEKQAKPDSAKIAALHRRLGDLLSARNQTEGALDRYRRAVSAAEKLGPADARLAAALIDLGFALESQQKFAQAEPLYRRALAIQEKALSPRHPEVGVTLNNLAGVVGASGRLAQAELMLTRAVSILETTLGPNHARVAAACSNLGDLEAALGKVAAAKPLWARAIAIYERLGDAAAAAEVRASASAAR